jgi:hypothetical protein
MNCPHCKAHITLTWRRYLKEPFGRHTCPECGRRSKLSTGWKYWLLYLPTLWLAPFFIIFVALFVDAVMFPRQVESHIAALFAGPWLLITYLVLATGGVFIDRWADERMRRLVPMARENAA